MNSEERNRRAVRHLAIAGLDVAQYVVFFLILMLAFVAVVVVGSIIGLFR